jgi:hypothetical protein
MSLLIMVYLLYNLMEFLFAIAKHLFSLYLLTASDKRGFVEAT